jgi:hypothetical protein
MGPSAGLDNMDKAQFSWIKNLNIIPGRSKLYPNHYTLWTVPAPLLYVPAVETRGDLERTHTSKIQTRNMR